LVVAAMQVSWWVELALRPGCLEEFARLTGEMVASAQAENGVLAYQRFISEDRQTVYVHERYEDSSAAILHLRAFMATFDERHASMVERKRFLVFGEPSDELRMLLDRYGATYHRPFGPFFPRSLPPRCSGDLDQEMSPSTQPTAFSDRAGATA
jgi:quinol monooxygenase YgiN